MADISVIIEVLGSKEIERATKSMSSLEGRVDTLRKSLKQGRISEDQFNQGLKEIRRSVDSQFPSWQKAKAAIDGHVKALDQLEKSKAVERHNKETERLKLQYNSTYRAAQSFKTQLRELGEAHSRGAISADRHEQQVRELKNEYRAFLKNGGGPMNQFGQIASKNTRVMKRFGAVGVQQLGYQIQDFAVQVQSGTSVLVALGQQGSQLLGIFGPAGAIAGMILAIGTGLAGAFLATKRAADSATESIMSMADAQKELNQSAASYESKISQLQFGVDSEAEAKVLKEMLRLRKEDARIREQMAKTDSLSRRQSLAEDLKANRIKLDGLRQEAEAHREVRELYERESYVNQMADVFQQAQARIRKENGETLQQTIEDERRAKAERESYILEMVGVFRNAQVQMRQASKNTQAEIEQGYRNTRAAQATLSDKGLEETIDLFEKTRDLKEELGDAAYEALRVAGVDMSALAKQLSNAGDKASRLEKILSRVASYGSVGESITKGPGGLLPPGGVSLGLYDDYIADRESQESETPSGGGMSAAEKQAQEFEKLKRSLDDAYASQQKFNEGKAVLDKALKSGLIPTTEEYKRLLGLLREEYDLTTDKGDNFAEDMAKIAQKAKDAMGDAFMSIVDGSKSAGDAFKDMARIILKQAFELLVVKPIMDGLFGQNPSENGIGGLIGSILGQKNGGAWNNGVQMYANGGVVTAPTGFQHSGGLGVMGEAGPEAIMPLKRGKNGKLGVQVEGGSQGNVTVQNHFHIAANGDDSVKRIIAQEAPKIANLTQKQILDQRARGGAFKTTFG